MESELSVFIDESGDVGTGSEFYIVALVFHNQGDSIANLVSHLSQACIEHIGRDDPFHFTPVLRGHRPFDSMAPGQRKLFFTAFAHFSNKAPFTYSSLSYQKRQFRDALALKERLRKDIEALIVDNLAFFQGFDQVKIYYDNGQKTVKDALHTALESALFPYAIEYRDADPSTYRLFQLADYACGMELTELRYEHHETGPSEAAFFGSHGSFKKNYLNKLRKKRL